MMFIIPDAGATMQALVRPLATADRTRDGRRALRLLAATSHRPATQHSSLNEGAGTTAEEDGRIQCGDIPEE